MSSLAASIVKTQGEGDDHRRPERPSARGSAPDAISLGDGTAQHEASTIREVGSSIRDCERLLDIVTAVGSEFRQLVAVCDETSTLDLIADILASARTVAMGNNP